MEGWLADSPFARLAAASLGEDHFTLVDVGCSGGFDAGFRLFGDRLKAFGFDPDVEECERLRAAETLPGVEYINAFVAPPADHPFLQQRRADEIASRNVWFRLSGPQTMATREKRAADLSAEGRRELNLWRSTRLADPASTVCLTDFARKRAIDDIDFIKIDVDGEDFAILNDITGSLADWGVLGLGLEVSFDGSEGETENSFHNMDRLMRAQGFDLFGLSLRRYSLAALPGVFAVDMPAETLTGRPQLGDAIYLRDLADPRHAAFAASLAPTKLIKLAALAALGNVPDLAADILLTHRARIGKMIDTPYGLDLLAAQVQADGVTALSYEGYMAAYREDSPLMYEPHRRLIKPSMAPTPPPPAASTDREAVERLEAELRKLRRSTSWKITAPLRAAERWMKSFRARASNG